MAARQVLGPLLLALCLILPATPSPAAVDLVDITGRRIQLEAPARRLLLGEGRFVAALGVLDQRDPLSRVAGMLGEFERFDPLGYDRYREAFPRIDDIPTFGQTSADSASLEKAIATRPDAAVFGAQSHGPNAQSATIIAALEAAGIPVVFIDFRADPLANTAPSIRILGQLLGLETQADAFADFHEAEMKRVTDRLASETVERPTVMLEAHVGLREECCFSIARGMFADLIDAAGGRNMAAKYLPGPVGMVSLETVLAEQPDIYLGTAIGTPATALRGRIALGAGVTTEVAAPSLSTAMDRPGIRDLEAVKAGRVYAIWHHFYNSPLNVYAVQRFAKWFHPDLFADLDPEATLARMLALFHPVDLTGTYASARPSVGE
jgi:iron complex transport system substrate-binding protein